MAFMQENSVSSETVDQIQANLIAYFRLFAGLPGDIRPDKTVPFNELHKVVS